LRICDLQPGGGEPFGRTPKGCYILSKLSD
jgi:hypothetical protein